MTVELRPSSPYLDSILGTPTPVLDHGFLRIVDYMGNEDAIVRAARNSYQRGTRQTSDDPALVDYLVRHRHTTPLEFAKIAMHVKLPIFVARQWIRHRMSATSEMSARYSILDNEFYIPSADVIAAQSKTNKQGRADQVLDADQAIYVQELLADDARTVYDTYEHLLNVEADGVTPTDPDRDMLARELARMNLSLNFYTQWYWTTDLHNLLHFLSLRLDKHAQYEIRVYADVIARHVQGWVPNVWDSFDRHRLNALTLDAATARSLRALIAADDTILPRLLQNTPSSVRRELRAKLRME